MSSNPFDKMKVSLIAISLIQFEIGNVIKMNLH